MRVLTLDELLHTNLPPSPDQQHTLLHYRHELSQDIMIDGYAIPDPAVLEILHDIHIALHPIRNIPEDIMCEILSHLVVEFAASTITPNHKIRDSLSMSHPSWLLSHICRRWRRIIISAPLYWSRIQLVLEGRHRHSRHIALLLSSLLKRTAHAALDITVSSKVHDIGDLPITAVLLDTACCRRWRSASFSLTLKSLEILKDIEDDMVALERICIHTPGELVTPGVLAVEKRCSLYRATALRHLTIDSPGLFGYFTIPWPSIQTFKHDGGYESCLTPCWAAMILAIIPTLQEAAFSVSHCEAVVEAQRSVIVPRNIIPCPARLVLRDTTCPQGNSAQSNVCQIFEYLRMSVLEFLHLDLIDSPHRPLVNLGATLGRHVGGSLTNFVLRVNDLDAADLTALVVLLRFTSHLSDFDLHVRKCFDLEVLLSDGIPQLEKVQHITLSSIGGFILNELPRNFVCFVNDMRKRRILTNFAIDFVRNPPDSLVSIFDELFAKGLEGSVMTTMNRRTCHLERPLAQ